ncbi:MAG: carbonic anhydrase family protein [Methylophaga sp.]|nr:carbonic anhydrase family protein [Methylophaga sp.]
MKKAILFSGLLTVTISVYAEQGSHWGYSGDVGPKNWAALSADNFACSGKNQSPINLTGFIEAELDPIKFDYTPGAHEIINNGHTIQLNYQKGSSIEVDGQTFNLLQVHFHAPSENHINGQSYPLEAHFVHANGDGDLAVVAVMYQQGIPNQGLKIELDKTQGKTIRATASPNKTLKQIWSVMPTEIGGKYELTEMINLAAILPKNKDHYRFSGSLTTPPCSEGVRWLVMKDVVTVSRKQIEDFSSVLHEPNNRPLQVINSRLVLE